MSTAAYSYMIDMPYSLLPSVAKTDDILPGPAGLSTYRYAFKSFPRLDDINVRVSVRVNPAATTY
jgi:hypothetical protein